MLKTIRDIDIKGKRAFLRVDFNVPLGENNRVDENENWRIKKTLPTIEYLLKEKARLIIISHLSGKKSLKPIADYLAELIGQEVIFINEIIGPKVKEKANRMKAGEILMLENLRFYKEEEKAVVKETRKQDQKDEKSEIYSKKKEEKKEDSSSWDIPAFLRRKKK